MRRVFENITLSKAGTGIEINMLYETPGSKVTNIGVVATNITYIGVSGSTTKSVGNLHYSSCKSARYPRLWT